MLITLPKVILKVKRHGQGHLMPTFITNMVKLSVFHHWSPTGLVFFSNGHYFSINDFFMCFDRMLVLLWQSSFINVLILSFKLQMLIAVLIAGDILQENPPDLWHI